MDFFVFPKNVPLRSARELAELAREIGYDGYDVCLRPGFEVCPENVGSALPEFARVMREHGLRAGLVTGPTELTRADDPTAEPVLAAMRAAGVPLLKLGYFRFDPMKQDYAQTLSDARRQLDGWQKLAQKHGVRVCYHTHSGMLGASCGQLLQLLDGLDPRFVAAYIDPIHQLFEGERFPVAASMVRGKLCAVGLKDAVPEHRADQMGAKFGFGWTEPGKGWVDWKTVAASLAHAAFAGPCSVHALQPPASAKSPDWKGALRREIEFYRALFQPQASEAAAAAAR